jgi:hypothetical protein
MALSAANTSKKVLSVALDKEGQSSHEITARISCNQLSVSRFLKRTYETENVKRRAGMGLKRVSHYSRS